ncbi:caspase family protein [Rubrivirga sp.]|uniref:nSTAND1 domain-containing NTPase n=1 Tax=Rubrivirga sp. TaxID=1885344 RepID=UPI003B52A9D6
MDTRPDFRQSVAVVIGIDAYGNGVPPLRTAANDARRLAQVLADDHGYNVHLMLDEAASCEAITRLLADELAHAVGPEDRVLFYFAGHGVALEGDDGPTGYLLPQDARRGEPESYLHMPALYDALNALACRHMLVVLDSCFSGAFRWSATRDLVMLPEVIHQERYDRFILDPAWQAIASASHDQTALDELPGTFGDRGDEGGHSPFARALFEALDGAGDVVPAGEGDGVITASELYLYLEAALQPATIEAGHRQTPSLWPLAKHDKGEFIFLTPGHALNLPPAPPLTAENNPWRGLESYDEAHAELFFGRDDVVGALRETVETHPLTVVLGASGTGKSSVVKAGLVPRLKRDIEQAWHVLPVVRPGAEPMASIERAVAELGSERLFGNASALLDGSPLTPGEGQGEGPGARRRAPAVAPTAPLTLALSTRGVERGPDLARQTVLEDDIEARIGAWCRAHPDARLVLVVDQFEELVTMTRDADAREAALGLLLRLVEAHPERLCLILTLRSDFEPQFDRSVLRPHWAAARHVVPPMTQAEVRDVIERPASQRVLYFQPHDLVDTLIDEVIQTPGGLPLLSFALSEMYLHYLGRRSDDRALETVDYDAVGGVVGALRTRADAELAALDPAHQETMRRLMLRMVAAEGGSVARRRVARAELEYPDAAETERAHAVVRRLTAARLVVEGRGEDGEPYVEPAHDALVRAWDRLLGWIHAEQDRTAGLRFQQSLARVARDWSEAPDDAAKAGLLWRDAARGGVLALLVAREDQALHTGAPTMGQRWRRRTRALLPRLSSQTSDDDGDVWMNGRELAFARRSIRRRRNIRLGLGALVLLIVAGALTSTGFGLRAVAQERIAAENAAEARANADEAQANAAEAERQQRQAEANAERAERNAEEARANAERAERQQRLAEANAAEAERQEQVALANAAEADRQRQQAERERDNALSLALASRSASVLQAGDRALATLLAVQGNRTVETPQTRGALLQTVQTASGYAVYPHPEEDPRYRDLAERILAAASRDGATSDRTSWPSAVSPDGALRAVGGDFVAQLRDARTDSLLWETRAPRGSVSRMGFSSDGALLAIDVEGRDARLWDVVTRGARGPARYTEVRVPSASPTSQWEPGVLVFNRQGTLAALFDKGVVRVWDGRSPALQAEAAVPLAKVVDMAFSPDGTRLVFVENAVGYGDHAGRDTTRLVVWDVGRRAHLGPTPAEHLGRGALSPDGAWLAVSRDDAVRVWDVGRGAFRGAPVRVSGPVSEVRFSRDGGRLAIWTYAPDGESARVQVWDLGAQRPVGAPFDVPPYSLHPAFFDGWSLRGLDDSTVRVWDWTGAAFREDSFPLADVLPRFADGFDGPEPVIGPSGTLMAFGDCYTDCVHINIGLVDLTRRDAFWGSFDFKGGMMRSFTFSPDDRFLAIEYQGGDVQLWDVAGREPLDAVLSHPGDVDLLAFSPDGSHLVTAGYDYGTQDDDGALFMRRWDLRPSSWMDQGCQQVNRNLSAQEWSALMGDRPYACTCPGLPPHPSTGLAACPRP